MAPFFVGERRVRVVASRIQGITVEIGGDTTKLSTALSKVNKEIRDTQAQLKDVNKLLKLDPGNAELMAQKQRLLAQAVGETREKLEALRLAGQQANEALAKGEISRSMMPCRGRLRRRSRPCGIWSGRRSRLRWLCRGLGLRGRSCGMSVRRLRGPGGS